MAKITKVEEFESRAIAIITERNRAGSLDETNYNAQKLLRVSCLQVMQQTLSPELYEKLRMCF